MPAWELIVHDETTRVWQNDRGDGLALHFHAWPPDLAASLDDVDALRAAIRNEAAQAGAGLVEADVVSLDGGREAL